MKENIATPVQELFEKAGNYGKTTIELLKLKAIDKSVNVISTLATKTILVLIVAMFLITGSVALALWLGDILGKTYYGFLALAGFYGFIILVLVVLGNQLIRKPVSNSVIKKYFNKFYMQKIRSANDLADAIDRLEKKQAEDLKIMQEQSDAAYESLKPVNLIKNTIRDAASSGVLKNNLLNTSAGLTAGFLLKKILVGKSKSPVIKIIGNALMFGVTNLIGRHPGFMIAVKDKFFKTISYNRRNRLNGDATGQTGEVPATDTYKASSLQTPQG